jgi:hypothetical protein
MMNEGLKRVSGITMHSTLSLSSDPLVTPHCSVYILCLIEMEDNLG